MTMTNKTAPKGFTLIELLVVMAIMGILMALIVPKIGGLIDSAKEHKCRNNLKQLQVAVMSYMNDNGGYLPIAMSYEVFEPVSQRYEERRGWITWVNGSSGGDIDALDKLWKGEGGEESHEKDLYDDLGTGAAARFGVENGTLFPYMNNAFEHYVCPVMKAAKKDRGASATIYRTYAMNPFFRSPGNRNWWRVKATHIGTSAATYKYGDNDDKTYIPEAAKLLLFTEVVPSDVENETQKREKFGDDPEFQGDCCIKPKEDDGGGEYIAYDSTQSSEEDKYGIHESPISGLKASLAVFFDGHIEKVYSKTDAGKNSAWFYIRGLDPTLPHK